MSASSLHAETQQQQDEEGEYDYLHPGAAGGGTFEIKEDRFWLNGKPIILRAGEIHFAYVVASLRSNSPSIASALLAGKEESMAEKRQRRRGTLREKRSARRRTDRIRDRTGRGRGFVGGGGGGGGGQGREGCPQQKGGGGGWGGGFEAKTAPTPNPPPPPPPPPPPVRDSADPHRRTAGRAVAGGLSSQSRAHARIHSSSSAKLCAKQRTHTPTPNTRTRRRVPRALWRDRLERLKALGLNAASVYVFWNWHETRKGEYRFDGVCACVRASVDGWVGGCMLCVCGKAILVQAVVAVVCPSFPP